MILFHDPIGVRDPSAFIQETSGRGLPAAPHLKRRFSPSRITTVLEVLLTTSPPIMTVGMLGGISTTSLLLGSVEFTNHALMPGTPGIPGIPERPGLPLGPVSPVVLVGHNVLLTLLELV